MINQYKQRFIDKEIKSKLRKLNLLKKRTRGGKKRERNILTATQNSSFVSQLTRGKSADRNPMPASVNDNNSENAEYYRCHYSCNNSNNEMNAPYAIPVIVTTRLTSSSPRNSPDPADAQGCQPLGICTYLIPHPPTVNQQCFWRIFGTSIIAQARHSRS